MRTVLRAITLVAASAGLALALYTLIEYISTFVGPQTLEIIGTLILIGVHTALTAGAFAFAALAGVLSLMFTAPPVDRLAQARALIQAKRYGDARAVLERLPDDARAREWLATLDARGL